MFYFFAENGSVSDSDGMEGDDGFADDPDGFNSLNQQTERGEIKGDVENLQTQQETLISKVRELEEVLNTLEPKIDAATEQMEVGASSSATDSVNFLEPEVEDLKAQMAQLNEEISLLKVQKLPSSKINQSKMMLIQK